MNLCWDVPVLFKFDNVDSSSSWNDMFLNEMTNLSANGLFLLSSFFVHSKFCLSNTELNALNLFLVNTANIANPA